MKNDYLADLVFGVIGAFLVVAIAARLLFLGLYR